LPFEKRKLIFWVIIIVISACFFYLWLKDVQRKIPVLKEGFSNAWEKENNSSTFSFSKNGIKEAVGEQKKINANLEKILEKSSIPTSSTSSTSSTSITSTVSVTSTSSSIKN